MYSYIHTSNFFSLSNFSFTKAASTKCQFYESPFRPKKFLDNLFPRIMNKMSLIMYGQKISDNEGTIFLVVMALIVCKETYLQALGPILRLR
jgi:hypothetical protein